MITSNDPNRRVKSQEGRGEGELRVKGEFLSAVTSNSKYRGLPYITFALKEGYQKAEK